eukprot:CAMPEP_0182452478 /NCGR_PEP_ID=MMETSP1172-20130603/44271_1 /TAXON_ID=708627 /ORGANISM="Timspurckia oligopyrenoides, Strain CCMP3278" /LENGTH=562 /DNA_ID=CAMNT_0024650313 /DNA_START=30 /DNA_END=1715 /DNA_ORIENTATION=-
MTVECVVQEYLVMIRRAPCPWNRAAVVLCILSALLLSVTDAEHRYSKGQHIPIYGVRVGPLFDPFHTYDYFSLPFCVPPASTQLTDSANIHKSNTSPILDLLSGVSQHNLQLDIQFAVDTPRTVICAVDVSMPPVRAAFQHALQQQFWIELSFDELPVYALLGHSHINASHDALQPKQQHRFQLYTHMSFSAEYHEGYVVGFALQMRDPVPLEIESTTEDLNLENVEFSYDVKWVPSKTEFAQRFEVYLDLPLQENKARLAALANAFLVGVLLVGVVSALLWRTVRKDRVMHAALLLLTESDSEDAADGGASLSVQEQEQLDASLLHNRGWRSLHGDVFRPPPMIGAFAVLFGTGMQLLFSSIFTLVAALAGALYGAPSVLRTTALVGILSCSLVSGYYSGGFYQRARGQQWIRVMFASWIFLPGVIATFLYAAPWISRIFFQSVLRVQTAPLAKSPLPIWISSEGLLFFTVLWFIVALPLHILGSLTARNLRGTSVDPCSTHALPRPIPHSSRGISSPAILVPLGAVLPFCVVFVEVYHAVSSLWNYKFYSVFDVMLIILG